MRKIRKLISSIFLLWNIFSIYELAMAMKKNASVAKRKKHRTRTKH